MAVPRRRTTHATVTSSAIVGDWRSFVPEHVNHDRLAGRLCTLGRFVYRANAGKLSEPEPELSEITDVDIDAADAWLTSMDIALGSTCRSWAWELILRNSGR